MTLKLAWQTLTAQLLRFAAPLCCAVCCAPLPASRHLYCTACVPRPPSSTGLWLNKQGLPIAAMGRYEAPLSDAIRHLKYCGRSDLAAPLAEALWTASVAPLLVEPVALVPVPLHPKRLCERGYNQAALLAMRLASHASCSFLPDVLKRVRDTPHQASLNRAERATNVSHTMHAPPWRHPLPVVLVDDVLTTGATLFEAARAVQQAGATVKAACVLAVADKQVDTAEALQHQGMTLDLPGSSLKLSERH